MSITAIPPDEAPAGAARAELITALADVQAFYATHPGTSVPDCTTFSYEVPGGLSYGQKIAWLRAKAAGLAVPVIRRDGMRIAERWFGPVRVEAHVRLPEDRPEHPAARAGAMRTGVAA